MWSSWDWVLPAPRMPSAGPLTAVKALPALGVERVLLDMQAVSLKWKFLSPEMGCGFGGGREQRITGQTHSPIQLQHLTSF